VRSILARGENAFWPKASGLYTRVEGDAIKVSVRFVPSVFEKSW
jgi:hypothetical protein